MVFALSDVNDVAHMGRCSKFLLLFTDSHELFPFNSKWFFLALVEERLRCFHGQFSSRSCEFKKFLLNSPWHKVNA